MSDEVLGQTTTTTTPTPEAVEGATSVTPNFEAPEEATGYVSAVADEVEVAEPAAEEAAAEPTL